MRHQVDFDNLYIYKKQLDCICQPPTPFITNSTNLWSFSLGVGLGLLASEISLSLTSLMLPIVLTSAVFVFSFSIIPGPARPRTGWGYFCFFFFVSLINLTFSRVLRLKALNGLWPAAWSLPAPAWWSLRSSWDSEHQFLLVVSTLPPIQLTGRVPSTPHSDLVDIAL